MNDAPPDKCSIRAYASSIAATASLWSFYLA